jgi:hypothetical protein
MSGRLIVAIVTTLIYELALIAVVLWGLPRLGIYIPIPGLVVLVLALGAVAIAHLSKGQPGIAEEGGGWSHVYDW